LPAGNRPAQEKERHDADPERPGKNRERSQARSSDQTNHAGNLQAANFPERKPEKSAKNLPAIEWINREHVENEQAVIDGADRPDQTNGVWRFISPAGMLRENPQVCVEVDEYDADGKGSWRSVIAHGKCEELEGDAIDSALALLRERFARTAGRSAEPRDLGPHVVVLRITLDEISGRTVQR